MITKKQRNTIQKQTILNFLKSVYTHPSAEEVYFAVKKEIPNISKGTVYRNLSFMASTGEINQLNYEIAHFDAQTQTHAHFYCKNCGKILDIDIDNADLKIKSVNQIGEYESVQISFLGICNHCK